MLNEAPNNNDSMCVANIELNNVPNSNDAMRIVNNVNLTSKGTQQFSMVTIHSHQAEKLTYQRQEIMTR